MSDNVWSGVAHAIGMGEPLRHLNRSAMREGRYESTSNDVV